MPLLSRNSTYYITIIHSYNLFQCNLLTHDNNECNLHTLTLRQFLQNASNEKYTKYFRTIQCSTLISPLLTLKADES
jgi:hypothetical protein